MGVRQVRNERDRLLDLVEGPLEVARIKARDGGQQPRVPVFRHLGEQTQGIVVPLRLDEQVRSIECGIRQVHYRISSDGR